MKRNRFFIGAMVLIIIAALFISFILVFSIYEGSRVNELESRANEYMTTQHIDELSDMLVESSSGVVESTEVVERPLAVDDTDEAMETLDTSSIAEFDYSNFEYWQQNVLNTIAKTISECKDDEGVTILSVDMSGEVGHIIVKKDDVTYEADFDKESFALLNYGEE